MTPPPESLNPSRRRFLAGAALGGATLALTALESWAQKTGVLPSHRQASTPKQAAEQTPLQAGYLPLFYPALEGNQVKAVSFEPRLAKVQGISTEQLELHLGLYNGYVAKLNQITEQLFNLPPDELAKANPTYAPVRELHVEQTYALNGVILHEYYFGNLGGEKAAPSSFVKTTVAKQFGSWDSFVTQLVAAGMSMRGWAVVSYSMRERALRIHGLDTHNMFVPMGAVPLLVLDVYEHAYLKDFGTKRRAYIDAFLANVDWNAMDIRLQGAIGHG